MQMLKHMPFVFLLTNKIYIDTIVLVQIVQLYERGFVYD